MDSPRGRLDDASSLISYDRTEAEKSAATSPGLGPQKQNDTTMEPAFSKYRNRPRTYLYFSSLPYETEDEEKRQRDLAQILKYLYIAVQTGDFAPGALHWSRELRSWLNLKFDLTKEQRVKLAKLYYDLALAPGVGPSVADRFAGMFILLLR